MKRIVIVGAGPAGLMAAIAASERSAELGIACEITLVEKNAFAGKKLNITGKGRCNMTNACTRDEFLENVPVNPRFLYGALANFSPDDTVAFFESHGVPTKVERGRRVFPVSDNAKDVTAALVRTAKEAGVRFLQGSARKILCEENVVTGVSVQTSRGETVLPCYALILATGGVSYPLTGSTGDGYAMAEELGHTTVEPKPSLVPLTSPDLFCKACMGLSLRNVGLSFEKDGKTLYEEQGEMLFTHFGVTGPVILSASAHLRKGFPVTMHLDMKPALDEKTLDARLLRDFSENPNRDLRNCMNGLLPAKMIAPFLSRIGLDGSVKVNAVTKEMRALLLRGLKDLPLRIGGTRPIAEAIVTSGGISVKEVEPATMRSKKVEGLFFAGELLDVDAYTGGYNLQIAFATGRLAGENAVL